MECRNCGTEISSRTFYCGGCGRPVGVGPDTATVVAEEPGMEDLPAPAASREGTTSAGQRALCSLCLGAFPAGDLAFIEGRAYCRECSPIRGSRSEFSAPVETFVSPIKSGGPLPLRRPAAARGQGRALGALGVVLAAGVVLAYVSFFGGGGRIEKLLAGVDADRSDSVLLQPAYRAGDVLDYRLACAGAIRFEGGESGLLGESVDGAADLSVSADLRVDVRRVDSDGNAELLVELSGVQVDIAGDFNGQPIPMPPMGDLGTSSVRMTVDRSGRAVADSVQVEGGLPFMGAPGGITSGGLEGLPDGPVRIGDKWTAAFGGDDLGGMAGVPLDLQGASFKATYEVVGFKKVKGRDCVAIRMDAGMNTPLGSLDMIGAAFIDAGKRQLVQIAVDLNGEIRLAKVGASLEVEIDLELDLELR